MVSRAERRSINFLITDSFMKSSVRQLDVLLAIFVFNGFKSLNLVKVYVTILDNSAMFGNVLLGIKLALLSIKKFS